MKHIKKIKKLLALSRSANVHEAALAMEHAQRIMAEHNLTLCEVTAADVQTFTAKMAKAKIPASYLNFLARKVGDVFGCDALLSTRGTWNGWETGVKYVGIESSAELAGYAFTVLSRQIARDRKEFIAGLNRCKPTTKTRRADVFCEAWVWQASKKAQKLELKNEHKEAITAWMDSQQLVAARQRKNRALLQDSAKDFVAGAAKGDAAYLHAGVGTPARKSLE